MLTRESGVLGKQRANWRAGRSDSLPDQRPLPDGPCNKSRADGGKGSRGVPFKLSERGLS